MRLTAFLLSFVLFCKVTSASAQTEDRNPISVSEIKIGLTNLDHIRVALLEKGFKLQSNKQEDTHLHEYWFIPDPECPTICSIATFQINKNTSSGLTFSSFSYHVRKSKNPDYLRAMKQDVEKKFPLKKTQKVERTTKSSGSDKEETQDDYDLVYYSTDTKITVTPDDDGNWAGYDFSLSTLKASTNAKSRMVNKSTRKK